MSKVDLTLEYEFLQMIMDKLDDTFDENYFLQRECFEKKMTLAITCTKKIEEEAISKIIKILTDVDLAKFEPLRELR